MTVLGLLLAGPARGGQDLRPCLPWSVLAAQTDFEAHGHRVEAVGRLGQEIVSAKGAAAPGPLRELEGWADAGGVVGAEARCWLARAAREPEQVEARWRSLGVLRLRPGVGSELLLRSLSGPGALDLLLDLPEVGAWAALGRLLALRVFESGLAPGGAGQGLSDSRLRRAAERWPAAARTWLGRHGREDPESVAVSAFRASLGLQGDARDIPRPRTGLPATALLLPAGGASPRLASALLGYLRRVAHELRWRRLLLSAPLGAPGPSLDRFVSEGIAVDVAIGPVGGIPASGSGGRESGVLWVGLAEPSGPAAPGGASSSTGPSLVLAPLLRDEIDAHRKALGGGWPAPVVVLGPAGAGLERRAEAYRQAVGPSNVQVEAYPPATRDLSPYARRIHALRPGTLVLAVPRADADRALRYLAHERVWARRDGKRVRKGEVHPYVLAPGSFAHDPALVRRNADYLDGVRVATDLPPVSRWAELPGVRAHLKATRAYPPRVGVRMAALLSRLETHASRRESAQAEEAEEDPSSWLPGPTPFGVLELHGRALTFPPRVYIFSRRAFRPSRP